MINDIMLMLTNNLIVAIFIIILFVVLLALFIINSNLEDKRKFENNICPFCDSNFGLSLRQSITKTETDKHIHYSCPRCLGEGKYKK